MRTISIRPFNSDVFPVEAKTSGYSNVFRTVEGAKSAMIGRFGNCRFIVSDKLKAADVQKAEE